MKEKIYTIPVNDAFDMDCECPVCAMKKVLNDNAVAYTMGPSYMEDDIRAMTDAAGFCQKHIKEVYDMENRLGMSMVLKTHFDKVITDVKKMSAVPLKSKSMFKKEVSKNPLTAYIENMETRCFVCERVDTVFERYIDTVFYLWKSDESFRDKFDNSKGFCTAHYGLLLEKAPEHLKNDDLNRFVEKLNALYIANMERVRDDLEWFINKHDYKYANEPWNNAKDAIPRALTKTNSIL